MSIDPLLNALIHAKAENPIHNEMLQKQRDKLLKRDPIRSPYIYYEDTSSTVTGSSTSPILYGRCVVCNKPCNLKCSSCASHGTQWMYFCGQDHQMLIWPLHRRVCGKRSKPWSWPGLTKKEINEMIELSTRPAKGGPNGETLTWQEWLVYGKRYDPEKLESAFRAILESKLEPSDGSPLPASTAASIVDIRANAWFVSGTSGKHFHSKEPAFEELLEMLVRQSFNFLAYFELQHIGDLASNSNLSWWSDLQHHLVIMLSFICLCWQRGPSSVKFETTDYQKLDAYRTHTYEETMKYCREVIKPIDEELAKKLAWKLITPLVRNHSQMRATDSCPTM